MKIFKHFDKRYNPMLWWGLAIWLLCTGANILCDALGMEVESQATLMRMAKNFYQSSPLFCLLMLCVIAPFYEECSFRLWGVGKRWMVIVCFVLMALFSWAELAWWVMLPIAALALVRLMLRNEYLRNWIVAIGSSAFFMLCHISGYTSFSLSMVLGLTSIFGLALVLSYLTINISFWCSVALHVLNNSLGLLLPLLLMGGEPFTMNINTGDDEAFTLEAKPVAFLNRAKSEGQVFDPTAKQYVANYVCEIPELAAILAPNHSGADTVYEWEGNSEQLEARYKVDITYSATFNLDRAVHELMQSQHLVADTVVEPFYDIYITTPDGKECLLDDYPDGKAYYRIMDLYGDSRFFAETDTTGVTKHYCLYRPNSLRNNIMQNAITKALDFKVSLRPMADRKAVVITFRTQKEHK